MLVYMPNVWLVGGNQFTDYSASRDSWVSFGIEDHRGVDGPL